MAKSALELWVDGVHDEAVGQLKDAAENANKDFNNGVYYGLVTKHEFKESKAGNIGVLLRVMIVESPMEPAYLGESYTNWSDMKRTDAFKYLGYQLSNMGHSLSDPNAILNEFKTNPTDLFDDAKNELVIEFKLEPGVFKSGPNEGQPLQNFRVSKVINNFDLSVVAALRKKASTTAVPVEETPQGVVAAIGMSVKFKTTVTDMVRGKPVESVIEGVGVISKIDGEKDQIVVTFEGEEVPLSTTETSTDEIEFIEEQPAP